MSKQKVCIFPSDSSTDFLLPLYETLCDAGWQGWNGDSITEGQDAFNLLESAEYVIFLGHGSSRVLYGSPRDGELTSWISKENVDNLLRGKKLFLLSCNSSQFCETYSLNNAIGFGNMPTGMQDVKNEMEVNPDFPNLEQTDIDIYNAGLVRSLQRAFRIGDMEDMERLYSKIQLYANVEIVECLSNRSTNKFREIASLLQSYKNECVLY